MAKGSGNIGGTLGTALTQKSRNRARKEKRASEHERRAETIVRRNDILPDHRIVSVPIVELHPYTRRIRKFSLDDTIEAANIISTYGFLLPLFISRDGKTILDGELRYEAARWLQLPEVPCIIVDALEPAMERAVRIALNSLGHRRVWDLEALRLEVAELVIEEQPIDLLGFDSIELDQIVEEEEEPESLEEAEALPEGPSITRSGDVWIAGTHRLICGDARLRSVLAALLGDERPQLLFTDPPYNIAVSSIVSTRHREFAHGSGEMSESEFGRFLAEVLAVARHVMLDGAIAFMFMDWRQLEILLRVGRENGLELLNLITWVKANAGMGSFYRSQHELVVMFKKPGDHKNRIQLGANGRNRANVWFAPGAGTTGSEAREMLREHPTSKPVQMLADAIIDVTDPDDIILDSFGGSGSTLIAAEQTGRKARLVEIDEIYCDVIVRRWMRMTGEAAVLERTGQTFSEVAAEQSEKPVDNPAASFELFDINEARTT
jgi:DNA modification methylase